MTFKEFKIRFLRLISEIDKHDVLILAASLAYSLALALAPFILIMMVVMGGLGNNFQSQIVSQATSLLGKEGGEIIQAIIENSEKESQFSGLSGVISFLVIVISASAIFSQLRTALDKIRETKIPEKKWTALGFLKEKFLLSSLVLGFIFLMIISLLLNISLATFFYGFEGVVWQSIGYIVSLIMFFILFTMMFRLVPTQKMSWRRSTVSGITAALFFTIGKFLIGLYIGNSAIGSAYGAAGSLIVLLVWLYYSALTFYISCEFTNNVIFNE